MTSAQRSLQPVVDPIRPIGGRDGRDELDDLLLGEVGSQRVQIGGLDVPRITGQQVGEVEDCSLLRPKDVLAAGSTRLLEGGDLFVGQSAPLARSGVTARSVLAAVADRGSQVGKVFPLGR